MFELSETSGLLFDKRKEKTMTATVARARDADVSAVLQQLDLKQAPKLADGSVDWADIAARSYTQEVALRGVVYNRQAMTAYAYAQAVPITFNRDGTIAAIDRDAENGFRDRLRDHLKHHNPAMTDEALKKAWQRCRTYGRGLQHTPVGSFTEAVQHVAAMAGKARASSRKDAVQGNAAKADGVQGRGIDRAKARKALARQGEAYSALAAFIETLRMSAEQRAAYAALIERYDGASRELVDAVE